MPRQSTSRRTNTVAIDKHRNSRATDTGANHLGKAPPDQPLTRLQTEVVGLIRWGYSGCRAIAAVGFCRNTLSNWKKANPAFEAAIESARRGYRTEIADALHDSEAYARRFIDLAQRDQNAPYHLRLRAALAIVRRNPKQHWLPALMEDEDPSEPRYEDLFPQDLPHPDAPVDMTAAEYLEREAEREAEQRRLTAQARPANDQDAQANDTPPTGNLAGEARNNDAPRPATAPPSAATPSVVTAAAVAPPPAEPPARKSPRRSQRATVESPGRKAVDNQSSEASPQQPPATAHATATAITPAPAPPSPPAECESEPPRHHASLVPPEHKMPKRHNPTKGRNSQSNQPLTQNSPNTGCASFFGATGPTEPAESAPIPASTPYGTGQSAAATEPLPIPLPDPPSPAADPGPANPIANRYFLHRYESDREYTAFRADVLAAHEPATPRERMLAERIAQVLWKLRRIDAMEMAIVESTVEHMRTKHPGIRPAAAMAMQFLGKELTHEATFQLRMQTLRDPEEKRLEKLEAQYEKAQSTRVVRTAKEEAQTASPEGHLPFRLL